MKATRNVGNTGQIWSLAVRVVADRGHTMLILKGRLSRKTAPALEEAAGRVLDSSERDLTVDLSGVDYVSSAGLRVIQTLSQELAARGRGLSLVAPKEPVRLALELAGLRVDGR